ncbi:MAG: hypothetical protein K2W33_19030, partial [Burkholderiales bacterium]|nr:hypothetical protein [Burkholderiales bacterium]
MGSQQTAPYETEESLQGPWQHLLVRGRADGCHPAANRVDEFKTHRGDLTRQPPNHRTLHWAQAKVYGWLLCQSRGARLHRPVPRPAKKWGKRPGASSAP